MIPLDMYWPYMFPHQDPQVGTPRRLMSFDDDWLLQILQA